MRTPKLRRNGDGRAFAVFPNAGGKRAYFGTYGTPEAEQRYQAWLGDVMSAMAADEPPTPLRFGASLAELMLPYLEWSETNHGAGEHRNNRETLVSLLDPFCGEMRAAKFTPNHLRRFQTHLVGTGRYARTTINAHVKRVRRFVRWCQSRELVPPGTVQELDTVEPLRRGKTSAREPVPVLPVARAVWTATLPFLRPRVRAMVQIQFWCGMRPGEVCRLRPCDIDRSGPVWFYRPPEHKTGHKGKTLIKAIPQPAQAILEPWLTGPPDRAAFLTQKRRPFDSHTYGGAVLRAARRARAHGLPVVDWRPNQLRHAILTEIRETQGIDAAQLWAGHSEAATTMIYTWTATENLARIAERIGHPGSPPPPPPAQP